MGAEAPPTTIKTITNKAEEAGEAKVAVVEAEAVVAEEEAAEAAMEAVEPVTPADSVLQHPMRTIDALFNLDKIWSPIDGTLQPTGGTVNSKPIWPLNNRIKEELELLNSSNNSKPRQERMLLLPGPILPTFSNMSTALLLPCYHPSMNEWLGANPPSGEV